MVVNFVNELLIHSLGSHSTYINSIARYTCQIMLQLGMNFWYYNYWSTVVFCISQVVPGAALVELCVLQHFFTYILL